MGGEGTAPEAGPGGKAARPRSERGAWRRQGARGGRGTRRADVGRTPRTGPTTQQRRDNSPKMEPPALRPWRGPWKELQSCRSGQQGHLKSSWAPRRLGALALGNGGKVKGAKRALTVHGLPHRIQIRRRGPRRGPAAATTRHDGGRGRWEKGLTRNWSAFLSPGQSHRASPAHAEQAPPLALVAGVRLR